MEVKNEFNIQFEEIKLLKTEIAKLRRAKNIPNTKT